MVYLFPLLAGLLYGISGLINKRIADFVDNPILSSLLYNLFSLVIASLLVFQDYITSGILLSPNYMDWVLAILGGIICALSFWSAFVSIRKLPVSEQALLSRMSILTYTVGGFLILGETVTQLKFVGILLILIGIVVSSIRKGKFVFNRWVIIQLLSSFGFGLSVLIDNHVCKNFSSGIYVFINITATTIALLVMAVCMGSLKGAKNISKGYVLNTALAGIFSILAYFLIIRSYDMGGLVVVTGALVQLKLPLAVLGGYILYKERSDMLVKIIGIITVVGGIVLLKV